MSEKKKKVYVGKVVSDKMDKSRVVLVSRRVTHPLYNKVITRSTKFMVHDEKNETKIGDVVNITYDKPMSKNKCWRLVSIVEKAAENA